jgi:demethylmenaquinone methyltransferase/2-methoxy-6-polyprenyl-1,4-benzoquinol methylase
MTDSLQLNAGGKSPDEVRGMFARVAPRYDFLNHCLSLRRDVYWRTVTAREATNLGADDLIVDLCTGTGDLAFALHAQAPHARFVALDFVPEMLVLARQKAAAVGCATAGLASSAAGGPGEGGGDILAAARPGAILFDTGDALALPLPDNCAALATVAFGVRNLADLDRGLREMARILRPGGKVAILEFTRPSGWFFGPLYMFYLRCILPVLGRLLSRASGGAYGYLATSVQAFAGPDEMRARLAAAGFANIRAIPLTGGIVHLYVGMKPKR